MSSTYRTFLGFRVWPASILKVYFPFMISGSTAYFLFASAQVAMQNDSHDKWVTIVDYVKEQSRIQGLKNEATAWYEEQLAKGSSKAKH